MERLIKLTCMAAAFMAVAVNTGCASEPEDKPEPQASKESGKAESTEWTEEQKDAFKKAHERARKGEDN